MPAHAFRLPGRPEYVAAAYNNRDLHTHGDNVFDLSAMKSTGIDAVPRRS
jgi:hypothetical protein